jgi:hypothetical protein
MTARELRSCASKVPHVSRREAKQVARLTTTRCGGGTVASYHCEYCGLWHVGHGRKVRDRHHTRSAA